MIANVMKLNVQGPGREMLCGTNVMTLRSSESDFVRWYVDLLIITPREDYRGHCRQPISSQL